MHGRMAAPGFLRVCPKWLGGEDESLLISSHLIHPTLVPKGTSQASNVMAMGATAGAAAQTK